MSGRVIAPPSTPGQGFTRQCVQATARKNKDDADAWSHKITTVCARLRAEGFLTYEEQAQELNRRGQPSRRGRPWSTQALGTATPTATLQVSGTFTVSNSAQVTTPSIYVSTGLGYVGIGTSNPGYILDVYSAGNAEARLNAGFHRFSCAHEFVSINLVRLNAIPKAHLKSHSLLISAAQHSGYIEYDGTR